MGGDAFLDDFDGPDLDTEVWVPQYLPMWSSRAESAATYAVAESELRLSIPPDQGLWCAGDHEPPLRVSGIQSGVWSGPVGGTRGQQPFRDGTVVREFQPARSGWTPRYGHLEVRARMDLGPRSMASAWMVGREEEPTRGLPRLRRRLATRARRLLRRRRARADRPPGARLPDAVDDRGVRLSDEDGRRAGTTRAAARRGQRPRGDLALTRLSRS